MKTQVLVIGCSYESINTAIWLASLNKTVRVLSNSICVDQVLANYKFDAQMTALWQMYTQMGCIHLVSTLTDTGNCVWLFVDALDGLNLDDLAKKLPPKAQLILSGSATIGVISDLTKSFQTPYVSYIPFVFIKDGAGFASLSSPDLVMVGEKTLGVHAKNELVLSLLAKSQKHYVCDVVTVEFARSTIMAMLATRLSFMNEMARLADNAGVDIAKIQLILGLDQRIGSEYLSAGWGFGGQTLPHEVGLLDQFFKQNRVGSHLLSTVVQINEDQKELVFRKFWRYFDGFIDHKKVVIWGAGYRAGTGRTTNSAIHPLLKLLWSYQIHTLVYAPNAGFELETLYGNEPLFGLTDDAYDLHQADALFILNWSDVVPPDGWQLSQFDLPIFDGKNLLDDQTIQMLPGVYEGVGRRSKMF